MIITFHEKKIPFGLSKNTVQQRKKINFLLDCMFLSCQVRVSESILYSALARINHYLTPDQKILLFNSIVKSQFSYCPLIWMFTSRYLNNELNRIHERALLLICNDCELPFDGILEDKSKKACIKIYWFTIEIYKFQADLKPPTI